jgi:hypothetical protein
MLTPSAPIASALKMSVPRLKPLSAITGTRPPTAATMPGKASIVLRFELAARPPWLDTTIPSAPWPIASSASSGVTIPFTRTFIDVASFKRST